MLFFSIIFNKERHTELIRGLPPGDDSLVRAPIDAPFLGVGRCANRSTVRDAYCSHNRANAAAIALNGKRLVFAGPGVKIEPGRTR
jgi:hypothetical protein